MLAALLHLVTLWFSGGDTSLIALGCCAIAAVLVPALWGLHRRGLSGWVLFVIGVALIGVGWRLAFSNIGSLTSFVGRSPMLSSRRVIWADVRTLIHERPFLGYGYWGLWDNQTLTAATYAKVGSPYGSAHNSVLEVLTMLGAVGFVVYFQICVFSIGGVIRAAWFKKSVATWWWTLLLVYLVVQNVTESFVLWHSYNWVLFIAAGFAASKCSSRVVPTWLGNSDRTHEQHLERA